MCRLQTMLSDKPTCRKVWPFWKWPENNHQDPLTCGLVKVIRTINTNCLNWVKETFSIWKLVCCWFKSSKQHSKSLKSTFWWVPRFIKHMPRNTHHSMHLNHSYKVSNSLLVFYFLSCCAFPDFLEICIYIYIYACVFSFSDLNC